MDMTFESNIVIKHIENILDSALNLELQNNILKHKLNLALSEAENNRKDAIKWAKRVDELEYELNIINAAKMSGVILRTSESERR